MRATKSGVVLAVVVIACGLGGFACRPIPLPELACPMSQDAFTQDTRLAAMLSVHAYAYFGQEMKPNGLGPDGLVVTPLTDAIRTLRCDPEPIALSRRRRAIAKLLAYDWPGERYRNAITALGADVPRIISAMQDQVISVRLAEHLRHNRKILEFLILRLTAATPSLIRVLPAMADASTETPTPTLPTPTATVTPTPFFVPPPPIVGVTATPTPGVIFAPVPSMSVVNLCAQGWKPEAPYSSFADASGVHSHAYISIPDLVRDRVAKNVDPQSWDQCSTFWPRPALAGEPPDSATLADVTPSGCKVPLPQGVQPTAVPFGSRYSLRDFYEHFRCVVSPCDSEFKNVLKVYTDHLPVDFAGTSVTAYHVHYNLPECRVRSTFDGAIWGRVQDNTKVLTSIDWGNIDTWEYPTPSPRTYIRAEKHVAFSSITYTNSLDAILKYTELNEQLSEIACCKKNP